MIMFSNTISTVVFVAILFISVPRGTHAQDWPQWRGIGRDGVVTGFVAPKTWPDQLKPKWKVSVGTGHSSPLVAGQHVYVHSRQGESEVVAAYDLNTGKRIWQDAYRVEYAMNPAARGHGKGPKSTPAFSQGKLYTLGISGVLSCYDAANGKLLWRKESSALLKADAPLYGAATSPLVDRGLVIVFLGGNDSGALAAFDAITGTLKWRWNGDGPGYASPIIVEIAGKRQIVTQSQRKIVGIWEDSGHLLWQIPFQTEYVQNIVTPLAYKDLLIFSGLDKGVFAVKVGWRDNGWVTDSVWQNNEVSMYMSSPVVRGNLLFGLSHRNKGQFFCLDGDTGRTLWTGDPRQGDNAAIVVADDLIVSLTNDANLIVMSATDKTGAPMKKYRVSESPTWAHPVVAAQGVLIKDEDTLVMLSL
jgi:outer membrane protein assembly factor BamB